MNAPFKQTVLAALLAILILASPALGADPKSANKRTTPAVQQDVQQQLAEQQRRILELERLLKEQGLLLEALRQHWVAQEQKATPAPNSASAQEPATQGATPNQELDRISGELDAVAQSNKELGDKVSNIEKKTDDNEKNITAKTRGLGNFTFSGDVRVRYEPFFGGTASEDRHRERIRLRFNANAKFNDEISGGLTIASGDSLDPISTNQTLTSFFQRKFIAIDKAFINYNPKWYKPLTLTGGKFAYTWYRNELTFDNDLNPEGFSQAFSWDFKNPVFKKLTLVGAELPFNELSTSDDSFLYVAQVGTFWKLGERVRFSAYAGFNNWHLADPVRAAQVAGTLVGNSNTNTTAPGNRYASKFAILNLIGRFDIDTGKARWPLMLQLDFANNTRACTNVFVATCNPRDRSGWWAEVQVGKTVEKNDLNFGYTFIRVEREAVLAAFSFSDLRSATNVVNHRFNFGYQAFRNITLNYALFVGRQLQTATSPVEEPWLKRMQFDVLYKF